MPEPQTTPLDEALDNTIVELHAAKHNINASAAFNAIDARLHFIALVLRDTRERLARKSRVIFTDIEGLRECIDDRDAGTNEAIRLAVAAIMAPLAERIEALEARPAGVASLHVNGRDVAKAIAEIERSLAELATTVARLGTGRPADVVAAEREIAKQDRAELDAALSQVARLRSRLDDALRRLELLRGDLNNQHQAARLDNQQLRQRLCQLIGEEYTDHATVPYLLHEIEVRLGAGSDAATRLGDALQRQADAEAERKVTQAQLDKFTGACGDQAIQIAELRTQLARVQESHKISHSVANDVSEAEIAKLSAERDAALQRCADEIETLQDTIQNDHAALADALGIPPHLRSTAGLIGAVKTLRSKLHEESMMFVELAMLAIGDEAAKLSREGCVNAVRAHIESLTEQLAVADADRVPLRMELDAARGKLERLQPLLKELNAWRVHHPGDLVLCAAFDEWEAAETKANNPELDDVQF